MEYSDEDEGLVNIRNENPSTPKPMRRRGTERGVKTSRGLKKKKSRHTAFSSLNISYVKGERGENSGRTGYKGEGKKGREKKKGGTTSRARNKTKKKTHRETERLY